jgi:hypothetical protein
MDAGGAGAAVARDAGRGRSFFAVGHEYFFRSVRVHDMFSKSAANIIRMWNVVILTPDAFHPCENAAATG